MEPELWAEVYLYNIIDPNICYDKELDNYKCLCADAIDLLFRTKIKNKYSSYYIATRVCDEYNVDNKFEVVSDEFKITIDNNTINACAKDNSYKIDKFLEKISIDNTNINLNFISSNINSNDVYAYKDNDVFICTIYCTPKEHKLNKDSEIISIIKPHSIYTNIRIKYRIIHEHTIDIIALLK